MTKRVLITGIGGSIGIHMLANILESTDWEITGIDSFRHKGLTDRLQEYLHDKPAFSSRVKIITHDLVAPMSDIIESKINVDHIIHLASISDVDYSIKDPVTTINNNVQITLNMLEFARKQADLESFVMFSTDEVYGASGPDQAHAEWSTILPSNPYSASKACQEAIAISYWRTYDVPVVITNTMNNFGEMQQPNKFPAMVQARIEKNETVTIHGTPDEIGSRYYLHSQCAADAVMFILKELTPVTKHSSGEIDRPDRYNIVGDKRINNLDLARTIARLMGKELRYELIDFHSARPGHDKHYGLSGDKLRNLGWKAPVTFEKSLKRTIDWQRRHKDWL